MFHGHTCFSCNCDHVCMFNFKKNLNAIKSKTKLFLAFVNKEIAYSLKISRYKKGKNCNLFKSVGETKEYTMTLRESKYKIGSMSINQHRKDAFCTRLPIRIHSTNTNFPTNEKSRNSSWLLCVWLSFSSYFRHCRFMQTTLWYHERI